MSAELLRNNTRSRTTGALESELEVLLNDRDGSEAKIHDRIGFIRGMRTALQILDDEYAEMNR